MNAPFARALDAPSADEVFRTNSGTALQSEGLTWKALLAGVAYALILHLTQTLIFLTIRPRIARI